MSADRTVREIFASIHHSEVLDDVEHFFYYFFQTSRYGDFKEDVISTVFKS